MRRFLLASVFVLSAAHATAQFDTLSVTQKASVAEDSLIALFKRKDWKSYANYMHPSLIKLSGGKEQFVLVLEQAMQALESVNIDSFRKGSVLQIVKVKQQYQCVMETFLQMSINGVTISGSSYDLGFSNDGENWSFLRIDQSMTPAKIKELIPDLSPELKLPKSQYQPGKTLDEFLSDYQLSYFN
jgi:hypothetical protein